MRDRVIQIRVSRSEYATIKKKADEVGLTVSAYSRLVLKGGTIKIKD